MTGEMTQVVGILLMLNNYVHDVATGLLLLSALWLAWSARDLGAAPGAEAVEVFRLGYRRCVRFVAGSLGVIVATGVIRTLNFMRFEWMPALGRGLVPVLVVKHVILFGLVGAGAWAWARLRGRLKEIPGWDR